MSQGNLIPIANPLATKRFRVRVRNNGEGVVVTCDAPTCMSRAATEAEALDKIRAEIRYRVEFCPCSGVSDEYVQLDVERG